MRPIPRLHVITDDAVLARDDFAERVGALVSAHGDAIAIHLRGPATGTRRLYGLAAELAPAAREAGSPFLVNDRADIALAVGAEGVQVGWRSIPPAAARGLHRDWLVGASVHGVGEAEAADGADFLVVGTIWPTSSHPDVAAAGVERIEAVRARVALPVIAIGGVTPARVAEARAAGARGVAALSGVWDSDDPVRAAGAYLDDGGGDDD